MKSITFKNGDRMPLLGLGTWRAKPDEVYGAVVEAVRAGYRHIDCAAIYGNEKEVGKALHDLFAQGIVSRDELFVTSKLWNSCHAPEDVEPALMRTLSDLGLDYIDLYLIHWPIAFRKGVSMPRSAADLVSLEEIPLEATWEIMEDMATKKLARHIGVSNFGIEALERVQSNACRFPEMNQIEVHPYLQQNRLVDYCYRHGIAVTAYSPLGSRSNAILEDAVLRDIARKHGCTPAQVVLAWLMGREIVAIPKSVHPDRIRENFGALDVSLDVDDRMRIASLDRDARITDGSFAVFEGGPYTRESIWGKE